MTEAIDYRAKSPIRATWGTNDEPGPSQLAGWELIGVYDVESFEDGPTDETIYEVGYETYSVLSRSQSPVYEPDAYSALHSRQPSEREYSHPEYVAASFAPAVDPETGAMGDLHPAELNDVRKISVVALRASVEA